MSSKQSLPFNNGKGQSMMELVIALGLLSIVVTVLTVAMINGLKNSQFSKNQVQATKLAQQGLEKVRTIRERNYTVCGPAGVTDWSLVYTIPMVCSAEGDCIYSLQSVSTPAPSGCTSTEYWLNNVNANQPEKINVDNIQYERLVRIKDFQSNATQKNREITIIVSWTDISGTHNSKLVTVFAQ